MHAEQELAGTTERSIPDGCFGNRAFQSFFYVLIFTQFAAKKERGQGEEKEKEEEEVAVRRTWVMELQAVVSVLTTLCLSDGDCGGG